MRPSITAARAKAAYAVRRADEVTTICEGLRKDLVARGAAAERVTVIPNAVDTAAFAAGRTADPALRAELGLEDATVVGFAGSFYAYEGLDLLLAAMAALLPKRPDLRALLVGGGPQEQALRAQAAALNLADRVVFTGRVPHERVQRFYELIDVLVYPRRSMRLTELVTPLKPLEAMAQGRMLVASDVGGHRELIRHGETGWLFAAGDPAALARAIDDVLSERGRWPQVAAAGRRFVEAERTWERSVERYDAVYRRAMHRRRPLLGATAVHRG
jgi:glycogen(starch) synthase